ncbi:MAG: DUF3089 domain-containing protein [Candidatus Limnocylindrales bacterium]
MRQSVTLLSLAAAFLLGACQSSPSGPSTTPPRSADAAGVVWLCRPGIADNPCAGDLSTTVVDAQGKITISHPVAAKDPAIDCFFVYPTQSMQQRVNADLTVDPELIRNARAEAALFSQVCTVYAPIYPQLTHYAHSIGVTQEAVDIANNGLRAGFDDYMANYNHGRGIVFIGHSQGAMVLTGLLQQEVDARPEVRKLLVSALLMGGNVTVPVGELVGGDFANIPACTSKAQTGCVVAYSSFDSKPPSGAAFGIASRAADNRMVPMNRTADQQVLCVNPAAPGGGSATLDPYWLTLDLSGFSAAIQPTPATPYTAYPNQISAECRSDGDASWLQIDRITPNDLPSFHGSEGPTFGLHDFDMHLAMGNLVDLVRAEAATYH